MGNSYSPTTHACSISFSSLIKQYSMLQKQVLSQIKSLASSISGASPGKFLLVQFGMSQITQIGESISNMISQVNSLINMAVRNQKAQ
jgi:hypothetical protein